MSTPKNICSYQQMPYVRAFTDGSAIRSSYVHRTFAGWAYILMDCKWLQPEIIGWGNGMVELDKRSSAYIGANRYSSNTAELSGIFWAAAALMRLQIQDAIIFSDSLYSVKSIKGLYSLRKNRYLIKQVRELVLPNYRLQWIKGHAGNRYNELVDALASDAVASI